MTVSQEKTGSAWRVVSAAVVVLACAMGLRAAPKPAPARASVSLATAAPSLVAMWVGGQPVTAAELNRALQQLPPPQRTGYRLNPKLAVRWYGRLVALSREARREHLDRGLHVEGGSIVGRRDALAAALVRKIARDATPTPQRIEAYYREHQADFLQARGRLLCISYRGALASTSTRTPRRARRIIEALAWQLRHGADFAMLARKASDDAATRARGGAFGFVSRHVEIPSIDRLLWRLRPGETSAPVRTRFGYELVRVEQRRVMPLAEARPLIVGKLRIAAITARTRAIVAAAHIRMNPALAGE